MKTSRPLVHVMAPIKHNPSVTYTHSQHGIVLLYNTRRTAGLNRLPVTLKKIHALTARENPKASEMYSSCARLGPVGAAAGACSVTEDGVFATCVAAKAKSRNKKVPISSPIIAIRSFRSFLGIQGTFGRLLLSCSSAALLTLMRFGRTPGSTIFSAGWWMFIVKLE